MEFDIVQEPDEEVWRSILRLRPEALIFQWPEMYKVYQATPGVEPGVLLAVEKGSGRGLACLAWERVIPDNCIARWLMTRCVCRGGPVYDPQDDLGRRAARALVERHVELMRGQAVYTQFRNAYPDTGIPEVLDGLGQSEPHCNFIIDLREGPEAIWRDIKPKRRRGIRRAEKLGVEVETVTSLAKIRECYEVLAETHRRAHLPLFDVCLFETAAPVFGNRVRFYLAVRNSRPLATRIVLLTRRIMYDWFAGTTAEGKSTRANELIVWHALRDAYEQDLQEFDFGEGGNPSKLYGPREFKRSFGGTLVQYERYVIPQSDLRYQAGQQAFRVVSRLRNWAHRTLTVR